MRFWISYLSVLSLALFFLLVLPANAQPLDDKGKAEAKRIIEEVKLLKTETERVNYLVAYLEDNNSLIPEYALSLLGSLKSKEAVPFLNNLLGSSDERYRRLREFVPQVLANIADKRSVEPLIDALGDKNLIVAKRSAIALTMIAKHNPGVKFDTFEQNQKEAVNLWRNWWQENKEVVEINEKQKTKEEKSGKTQ